MICLIMYLDIEFLSYIMVIFEHLSIVNINWEIIIIICIVLWLFDYVCKRHS